MAEAASVILSLFLLSKWGYSKAYLEYLRGMYEWYKCTILKMSFKLDLIGDVL